MANQLDDVLQIHLRTFKDERGNLVPIESKFDSLMSIKRVFYVYDVPEGFTRGKHSHIKTSQLMICVSGKCLVRCFDGAAWGEYSLQTPNQALFVPPGIWSEETYVESGSTLMVLCDTHYDQGDYIFSLEEFEKLKEDEIV